MKKFFNILILILLSFKTKSLLPPEEREKLLNKYAKKVSPESLQSKDNYLYSDYLENDSIDYDVAKINEILTKNGFPERFNFLTNHSISVKVKNQGSCKCGWALSAATALSYRFNLKYPNIDLSSQYSISCYLPDCKGGNNLIDPQLNLIKNGTVTEECLPYSSGSGTITDTCPEKCKDGTNLTKYYSQNAYLTEGLIKDMDSYYNIVTLIIDQLISKGPMVSRISLYQDFGKLMNDPARCPNEIYKYDGTSQLMSQHALVIIGYDYSGSDSDKRYYWIVQNSMGGDKCPDGLMKIEFGQVQIESVAFSEPYLEKEDQTPKEIKLKYNKIKEDCDLDITYNNDDLNDWANTLEVSFKSEDNIRNFNIQCGAPSFEKLGKKFACYYEEKYNLNPMQKYVFNEYKSLGKDNTFKFEPVSDIKDFIFYGNYHISSNVKVSNMFFVSEEGSKVFLFLQNEDADKDLFSPIYSKRQETHPLSDCKKVKIQEETSNYNLIVCELKKDEINYFDEYKEENKNQMAYDILCGTKKEANTYAYKLDKTKYPIFRFKKVLLETSGEIQSNYPFEIETLVDGTISDDYKDQKFMGFIYLEKNSENKTYTMTCQTGKPNATNVEHNITCSIQISEGETKQYDKLYFLPYLIPYKIEKPYEVILKKTVQPGEEIKPEPQPTDPESDKGFSKHLKLSLMVLSLLVLLI